MAGRRRFNAQERVTFYLAQGGRCSICGAELRPGWHGDHIDPWSHGGITDVINGQALCPTCNLKKGSKVEEQKRKKVRIWQVEATENT